MGYAFMSTNKVKTIAHLDGMMGHNYRLINVANADPEARDQNDEIIRLKEASYKDAYRSRIAASEYYKKCAVRKDAVKAIEIMMTYSREDVDKVDIQDWKEANAKWLMKTFSEENVISAVYHGDEATPHIHAVVIPMVNDRLNSCNYIGGISKLKELQTSYAKAMEPFGLKRGLENSKSLHKEIKKFYAEFNRENSKDLPPVIYKNGQPESAAEYRERANIVYNISNIDNYHKLSNMQRNVNVANTLAANNRTDAAVTIEKLKKDIRKKNKQLKEYTDKLIDYDRLSARFGSIEDMEKQMITLQNITDGKDEYKEAFPEKAQLMDTMHNGIIEVLHWKHEKERLKDTQIPEKE